MVFFNFTASHIVLAFGYFDRLFVFKEAQATIIDLAFHAFYFLRVLFLERLQPTLGFLQQTVELLLLAINNGKLLAHRIELTQHGTFDFVDEAEWELFFERPRLLLLILLSTAY